MKTTGSYKVLFAFAIVSLFAVSSCKTTKNNWYYRGWHNMNARYNGYYYSKDNMKESIKKVEKAYKEDYTKLLPIKIYPDNKTAKTYYADFDKSIKKSSVVIQRHCITDKKKKEIPNACKWIDENYMLIGQSHFYKRDLFSALEAFEYVSLTYKNPEAKYGALLWMIKTDNEIGSYSLSNEIMDDLRNDKEKLPKDKTFQKDYALATTDYYIKEGDYADAIKDLTQAIIVTKKKSERARYTFILAQLYEKLGSNKKASMYYGMVPPLHPPYEMEFAAKIKQASLIDADNGDIEQIKRQLAKMLRDDKNTEYRDQIYYAFANIAYKEKDTPGALVYLTKSIKASTSNTTQKALSYLKRADIYFDQTNYRLAGTNYDSTMTVLPKDYPDYAKLDEKRKSLSLLIFNLNVISMEDSLQRLAALSEKERANVIDNMITKMEEDDKKKEEEKKLQSANQQNAPTSTTIPQGTTAGTGNWYFYNPSTVNFGMSEFTKKWGSRKLEDNWNRADKEIGLQTASIDNNVDPSDSTDTKGTNGQKKNPKNKKDRAYYMKKIPLTTDAIAKSNAKIVDAYYNAGTIYKEQILNNQKSVETLEELLSRYPENKYKMSSYYQLYRTYLVMENQEKSDYYKNLILTKYPDTEYAKLIRNPEYAKSAVAARSELEKYYTETYQLYSNGKYNEALSRCLTADSAFAVNSFTPQFAFIKALCIGRTQSINAFESALTQVVIKFQKDPVKDRAQAILDAIKKQKAAGTIVEKLESDSTKTGNDTAQAPKFVFKEDGEYMWVAIVDNGKGNLNNFKTKLSNENDLAFSTQDLTIASIFLDLNHQLVSVKTFDGKDAAMRYYNYLKDKKTDFSDLQAGTYQTFIISSENYSVFYKDKNVEEYQAFFTENFQ